MLTVSEEEEQNWHGAETQLNNNYILFECVKIALYDEPQFKNHLENGLKIT